MLKLAGQIEKETAVGGADRAARNKVGALAEGAAEIVSVGFTEVVAIVQNRATGAERASVEGVELDRSVSGGVDIFFPGEFLMKRFERSISCRPDRCSPTSNAQIRNDSLNPVCLLLAKYPGG